MTNPEPYYRFSALNPKQQQVIDLIAKAEPGSMTVIGYGGAKGGGKTYLIVISAIRFALSYPGSRMLIARDEYNKLETTTMQQFDEITREIPGLVTKSFNQSPAYRDLRLSHWPEDVWSRVYFRGVSNWAAFGSEAYNFIALDEASEIDVRAAAYALTILRHRLPRVVERGFEAMGRQAPYMPYIFLAGSNPFPGWFADWFHDKKLDDILMALPESIKVAVHFVPARIPDNPHLPAGYEAQTRAALTAAGLQEWADRLIEGRFDVYEGKIYEHFSPSIHKWLKGAPKPEEYNRVIGGLDFGQESSTAHFTAGIVSVVTTANRLIRVAEFKDRGPAVHSKLLAWMMAQEARWGDPIHKKIEWVADRSQGWGISHYKNIFTVRPSRGGNDSVDSGIGSVALRLEPDESGLPGSFYLPELVKWEEEMMVYHRDPETLKVIEKNDDLNDADRYSHERLDRTGGPPPRNRLPRVA